MGIPSILTKKLVTGRKKNHISMLYYNGEEVIIEENLIKHVADLYKYIFGQTYLTSLRLD
jgi:hypothetical protein